jgi:hypothetical protein
LNEPEDKQEQHEPREEKVVETVENKVDDEWLLIYGNKYLNSVVWKCLMKVSLRCREIGLGCWSPNSFRKD